MSVSNEFSRPDNEDLFEEMCFALYRRLWNDITCRRVGRSGQEQRGIDILGNEGAKAVGVQCKHYNKTPFTIATIRNGIARAETANAPIEHLLFATTKSSDADLVFQVQELNAERQGQGKFTVSVDSWAEISAHVRMHPEIGRTYIPNFPGSAVQEIRETTFQHLALYREDRERPVVTYQDPSSLERKIDEIHARVVGSAAQGDEEDIGVARILDRARDLLRELEITKVPY